MDNLGAYRNAHGRPAAMLLQFRQVLAQPPFPLPLLLKPGPLEHALQLLNECRSIDQNRVASPVAAKFLHQIYGAPPPDPEQGLAHCTVLNRASICDNRARILTY